VRARAALLACALWTSGAWADDTNQRALKLAYEADDLYARGQWAGAYDRFAEADGLAHSPVFVLYMARCRKNAARLIEAEAIFTRLSRETLARTRRSRSRTPWRPPRASRARSRGAFPTFASPSGAPPTRGSASTARTWRIRALS
jgi:hypothetical protein